MSFLKRIFGPKLDGDALAQSPIKAEYAQIDLLARFSGGASLASEKTRPRWNRVLPRPYDETIDLFVRQGWLAPAGDGYTVTAEAQPYVEAYRNRIRFEKPRLWHLWPHFFKPVLFLAGPKGICNSITTNHPGMANTGKVECSSEMVNIAKSHFYGSIRICNYYSVF